MTTNKDDEPGPGDWRRAAELMTHRASQPKDLFAGIEAVLTEANERGRIQALLRALDAAYQIWAEKLRTPMALGVIPELIDDHATEHPDRHIRLAAQVVRAMRTEDRGAFNDAIVQTINEPNGSGRLIVAVSDLYSFILPELATPSGRRSLSEWAVTIASYEKGDE